VKLALAAALFFAAPVAAGDEAARLMGELMSGKPEVGAPFTLPDTAGRPRALAEFRGKLVLLYFGYMSCPDACPRDLAQVGGAIRALGPDGERVQPVFVTIDPARDAPEALRAYVAAFHPRFVALRGSEEETRRVARTFKVAFERTPPEQIEHAAFTFLLDGQGRYVAFFPPGTSASLMAEMLRQELDRGDGASR